MIYFFPHRAFAAFAAICERLRGLRAAARVSLRPPLSPKRPGDGAGSGWAVRSSVALRWIRGIRCVRVHSDRAVLFWSGQA